MYKPIQAKVLLSHNKQPDTYFGLRYNMNLYRGCEHRCIYCDSRSECYQIEDFDGEVLVKVNAIELLRKELASKRVKGVIGLGSMNDPYMPLEAEFNLAGRALEVISEFGFPVHVITKSDLVLKDLETLRRIAQVYASVSFTITTADDDLAAKVEPLAPRPSARLAAMRVLADNGIQTGVTMMPILPFIEDTEENIAGVVEQAAAAGASYILPSMGMTLRDRQRAYYYRQLDRLFPGLREKYQRVYGDRYSCHAPYSKKLYAIFGTLCMQHGVATKLPQYAPQAAEQLSLFS
ncbi:MAG: radical SAM protein [Anaerolineales bacterium]|nr:radical SAM protein [Anaerolineales bacterium]